LAEQLVESLPSTPISILISPGPLGNQINATVTIGFEFSSSDDTLKLGFRQEYLKISDGALSSSVLGLGYDEMREYPFFYTSEGCLFDYRLTPHPSWISRRYYAAWTETSYWGGYLGPISQENISKATVVGDVIEFENLTIYYEDSTSFVCGPSVITIGAKFTLDGNNWSVEQIVNASDEGGVTIKEEGVEIIPRRFEPVRPVVLIALFAIPVIIVSAYLIHKRITDK